jgi:hypothetical protein
MWFLQLAGRSGNFFFSGGARYRLSSWGYFGHVQSTEPEVGDPILCSIALGGLSM